MTWNQITPDTWLHVGSKPRSQEWKCVPHPTTPTTTGMWFSKSVPSTLSLSWVYNAKMMIGIGWESWSHFHNHNFSLQKRLWKCSAPDFDGRITFSWNSLPVNLPTFFPRRPAFSVECHPFQAISFLFFLFFFERLDITETASRLPRIQSWSSHQRSGEQSALAASTPKLIFLSVNACHAVFRLHFGNFQK